MRVVVPAVYPSFQSASQCGWYSVCCVIKFYQIWISKSRSISGVLDAIFGVFKRDSNFRWDRFEIIVDTACSKRETRTFGFFRRLQGSMYCSVIWHGTATRCALHAPYSFLNSCTVLQCWLLNQVYSSYYSTAYGLQFLKKLLGLSHIQ